MTWWTKSIIAAKALDGQRYLCPAKVGCGWSWGGSRVAAPKGSMTYAFTHMGDFLLLLLLLLLHTPLPQPRGPYLSLEAHIQALRPKSQSWGPNPLRLEFGPWGWDLRLEVGIRASCLGFGPQGWDKSLKAGIWALRLGEGGYEGEEEGGGENSPYVWKHRSSTPLGPLAKRMSFRFSFMENQEWRAY